MRARFRGYIPKLSLRLSDPPGTCRPALAASSQGWLWEAFFYHGKPYLGQAVLGEPVRQINVLSPTRRLQ